METVGRQDQGSASYRRVLGMEGKREQAVFTTGTGDSPAEARGPGCCSLEGVHWRRTSLENKQDVLHCSIHSVQLSA